LINITLSENIKDLIPYEPGKPIEELERELNINNVIKLASNENPLGPSPLAISALKDGISSLNRYPDGGGFYLKNALANAHQLSSGNFILGNGSNEVLELAARTFLNSGANAVMADQSFIVYFLVTKATGGIPVTVPLLSFHHDLKGMADAINENTRIIFVANPDNPTGTSIGKESFSSFLNRIPDSVLVIIDEAYHGYEEREDFPDSIELFKKNQNLIILRTFSKIHGLAGLRIGYGIASEEIISYMNRVRQPFNTSSLAQIAAVAALSDHDHVVKSKLLNKNGKVYLYNELTKMGINYVPTEANFILIEVGKGKKVYELLLREGIIVRPMDGYRFPGHIRVTISTAQENELFIKALKKVLNSGV
jgi:histidinol-phosphate aminotransferase